MSWAGRVSHVMESRAGRVFHSGLSAESGGVHARWMIWHVTLGFGCAAASFAGEGGMGVASIETLRTSNS